MRLFLCASAAAALAVVSTLALPASAGQVSQTGQTLGVGNMQSVAQRIDFELLFRKHGDFREAAKSAGFPCASDRTQTVADTTHVPQPIPTQPVDLSAQPAVATQPGVPQPVADQRPAWCYTLSGADEHRRFDRVCHLSPRHGRPHRR